MSRLSSGSQAVGALVDPQSIAIVGASPQGAWTRNIFNNLRGAGYPGRIFLVNPKYGHLWDLPCYPSVKAIPDRVDQALLVVRAEMTPRALSEAGERGCRTAVLYSSGYAETREEEGRVRQEEIQRICRDTGIRVCGPNCMGLISFYERVPTYPQRVPSYAHPGHVAILFQSGGTLGAFVRSASDRGIGLSYAISSGNEADLDLTDYLEFLVADRKTSVILLFIEGIRRPREFTGILERALAEEKPIVVVKVGKSEKGQRSTVTHTGVLAGSDEAFGALCRRYGMIRVSSLDELLETAEAFTARRLPRGKRLGVVVGSGGLKGLASDLSESLGLTLSQLSTGTFKRLEELPFRMVPDNPLDAGMAGIDESRLVTCAEAFLDDPNVDLLLVHGELPRTEDRDRRDPSRYRSLLERSDKPIFFFARCSHSVTDYGRQFRAEAGTPFLQDTAKSLVAMRGVIDYARAIRRRKARREFLPRSPIISPAVKQFLAGGPSPFGLAEGGGLLADLSVPTPPARLACSPREAMVAASTVGFPVALKIDAEGLTHKSDLGGVVLGVRDEAQVERAYREIVEQVEEKGWKGGIRGVLVQKMIDGGLETVLSFKRDPLYGPLLMFGLGGIFIEVLRDVSFRIPPLSWDEAASMVEELKGKSLFHGVRGQPKRDLTALIQCLVDFSCGVLELGNVGFLEINPLMVLEEGKGAFAIDLVGTLEPARKL